MALVRLGRTEKVWPLLRHSADPRLRSFIVNWLTPLGADPRTLVAELDRLPATAKPTPSPESAVHGRRPFPSRDLDAPGADPGVGGVRHGRAVSRRARALIGKLLDLYRNDPDAGIHGAAEWTLRQWKNERETEGD